jgi:hypothetical protein
LRSGISHDRAEELETIIVLGSFSCGQEITQLHCQEPHPHPKPKRDPLVRFDALKVGGKGRTYGSNGSILHLGGYGGSAMPMIVISS